MHNKVVRPGVRKSRFGYRAVSLLRVNGHFHFIKAWGMTEGHARHRLGRKVEVFFRDNS